MRQSSSVFYIIFGLILINQTVVGQALTNNNALITITPNSRMTILGGALNNGDLVNEGTLSVSGDWMNVDFYDPRAGVFILDGAASQNFAHNAQDIFQLRVSGGGEKRVTTDVQIIDTLDFVDGLVTTESGVTLQILTGGAVIGGSDISHVNGLLFHNGLGSKYYPVGKNGNFRPVELTNVTGTNPMVGFEVFEPNPDPQVPFNLLAVSDTRYWQMTTRSGTYDGSPILVKVGADENLGPDAQATDLALTSTDQLGTIFFSLGQASFTGSLLDGEVTSIQPAVNQYYALGIEGFAEERTLYVPNALSPAAANPEDRVVKVYGEQIIDTDFIFRIYNRWGKIVYETNSFTEANTVGWQGATSANEEEIMGVYQYTLSGRFASGNVFKRNGSITVIR